ncbi:hypothetical protein [Pseudomonas fluorescens]|uniref:Outer membrane lipoprotein SlyB n=1 Tax=Pseudomonas fluorescens TaxID=294 RepID=A0A5E7F9E5_PSEFL|nr:hypothetical protein [Pseudomonas fluorescens]VVO36088.1 hypothetical protein PS691_05331 [Pseudomonas fluorescens]
MKHLNVVVLSVSLSLFGISAANADEVISRQGDRTVGAGFGAGTGLMVGGAAGGPIGALVGAAIGLVAGTGVQIAVGQEGQAYKVRSSSGEERVVRSPHEEFTIGQQVEVSGTRLHATTP